MSPSPENATSPDDSPDLASFLAPGLSRVSGPRRIARRLAAAALLLGLALPAVVPPSPAAAGGPSAAVEGHSDGVIDADAFRGLRRMRDEARPYVAAALAHGLDPERFLAAAMVVRGLLDAPSAAPPHGAADPGAERWLDLVLAHGADLDAGLAAETLSAARRAEARSRRKPLVGAVLARIAGMRADRGYEAEILARAYAADVPADMPDGLAGLVLAYGHRGLRDVTQAWQGARTATPDGRTVTNPYAYKVLGLRSGSGDLLSVSVEGGGRVPLTVIDFVAHLDEAAARVRELARGICASTRAEGPPPPGAMPGFGAA